MSIPLPLLTPEKREMLREFDKYTVFNPIQNNVKDLLIRHIAEPGDRLIIVVIGPTGVGKSKLIEKLFEQIFTMAIPMMEQDVGYIPACIVNCIPIEGGKFKWSELFKVALRAVQEPLIEYKRNVKQTDNVKLSVDEVLRQAYISAIKNRKMNVCIYDEAQHITNVSGAKKASDQIDCFKYIVDESRVVHVLVGTYQLNVLQDLNEQLIRRVNVVHFPRYNANIEKDVADFKSCLLSLLEALPLPKNEPSQDHVKKNWRYYYDGCMGCIGTLKGWLYEALKIALCNSSEQLDFETHIKPTVLSLAKRKTLQAVADEGEQDVLCLLDGSTVTSRYEDNKVEDKKSNQSGTSIKQTKSKGKSGKPGKPFERNPKRTKTGLTNENNNKS